MQLSKKMLGLFLGALLLVSPSCKQEEKSTFVRMSDKIITFQKEYEKLDYPQIKEIGVENIYPSGTEIGYPGFFIDFNNDGKKDLVMPTLYAHIDIVNDYYSVLGNMDNYKSTFRDRMKNAKIRRKDGKILNYISLKNYLPIDNVMQFPFRSDNRSFEDVDNDGMQELVYDGSNSLDIYKWDETTLSRFFSIPETERGGPDSPRYTTFTAIEDLDSDGYAEIVRGLESRYKPFGLRSSRSFICYVELYRFGSDGKTRVYTISYAPKDAALGLRESSPLQGATWAFTRLIDDIWRSRTLSQKQKTENAEFIRRVTEYKL